MAGNVPIRSIIVASAKVFVISTPFAAEIAQALAVPNVLVNGPQ